MLRLGGAFFIGHLTVGRTRKMGGMPIKNGIEETTEEAISPLPVMLPVETGREEHPDKRSNFPAAGEGLHEIIAFFSAVV